MNELSKLTDKILAEAQAAAQAIDAAAQSDARQLQEAAKQEAEAEAQAILQAAKANAEAVLRRAQSKAGIEERNMKLGARRDAMGEAYRAALEKLCGTPPQQLVDFLAALVCAYQTEDAELIFNVNDQKLGEEVCKRLAQVERKELLEKLAQHPIAGLADLLHGRLGEGITRHVTLSKQVGGFAGGFILKEGAIETNCTFEVLVQGVTGELEAEVAEILFA